MLICSDGGQEQVDSVYIRMTIKAIYVIRLCRATLVALCNPVSRQRLRVINAPVHRAYVRGEGEILFQANKKTIEEKCLKRHY